MNFDTKVTAPNGAWRATCGNCELEVVIGMCVPGSRKLKWHGRLTTRGKWPVVICTGPWESAAFCTSALEATLEATIKELQGVLNGPDSRTRKSAR